MATRAVWAETEAFVELYTAAGEHGTSAVRSENIAAALSPYDDDPGFSPILNLADAEDKGTVLISLEELARSANAPHIGINGNPDIDRWVEAGEATRHGYQTVEYEFFWGRELTDAFEDVQIPDGASVEQLSSEEKSLFGETLNVGFGLAPEHVRGHVFASSLGKPGWLHYLARVDGQPACASVLYVTGDVAQLFVTTTVPAYRSRGLQTYMIRRRLLEGSKQGCNLAICQTVVDNSSPRNMARQGFQMLYKRRILAKNL